MPIFYNDTQLAEFQASAVREYAIRRRSAAERVYHHSFTDAIRREVGSLDDFLWGLTVTWSRLHRIAVKDSEGTWHKASCFLPVADLLNTASGPRTPSSSRSNVASNNEHEHDSPSTPNADCRTNDASTHFECFTTRWVKAGHELLVPYGSGGGGSGGGGPTTNKRGKNAQTGMPNGKLLLDYGFALQHNMMDTVTIHLPPLRPVGEHRNVHDNTTVIISPAVYQLQTRIMQSELSHYDLSPTSSSASLPFPLHYPPIMMMRDNDIESLPHALTLYIRLWSLHEELRHEIGGAREIEKKIAQGQPLSPSHESSSFHFLQHHLHATLMAYNTTLQQDEEILKQLDAQQSSSSNSVTPTLTNDGSNMDPDTDANASAHGSSSIDRDIRRWALYLRMGEKRLLYLYVNILAVYQSKLKPHVKKEKEIKAKLQAQKLAKKTKVDGKDIGNTITSTGSVSGSVHGDERPSGTHDDL